MSIRILTKDPMLKAMLLLEAKRQGFREEGEPSILLADLDTATLPADASGAFTVLLSADPAKLTALAQATPHALLSLPFSVRDFEDILHRYGGNVKKASLCREADCYRLNGKRVALSATESALLDLLYQHRDRTVSEAELTALLGDSATRTNTLAVYLYRLRRKLCADGVNRIRTVHGLGYRLLDG